MISEPLDLTLLQTFVEVAQRGSVAAAARALTRSQPAISHRLRALEEELGRPLFERVGRRLKLSPFGAELLERAAAVLAAASDLRQAGSPNACTVTIATLPTLAAHLLAPLTSRHLNDDPDAQWIFRLGLGPAIVEGVRRGEADLGVIAGYPDIAGVNATPIGAIDLAAALPRDWRSRGDVTVGDLRSQRYLAWTGLDDPTMHIVTTFVRRHRLADERATRVPHIETLRELVALGAGYTLLPTYTLRRDAELGRIAIRRVRGLRDTIPLLCVERRGAVATERFRAVRALIAAAGDRAAHPRGARSSGEAKKRSR